MRLETIGREVQMYAKKQCQWPDLKDSIGKWIEDQRQSGYIVTRNLVRIKKWFPNHSTCISDAIDGTEDGILWGGVEEPSTALITTMDEDDEMDDEHVYDDRLTEEQ